MGRKESNQTNKQTNMIKWLSIPKSMLKWLSISKFKDNAAMPNFKIKWLFMSKDEAAIYT